jgi:hypothetical protein
VVAWRGGTGSASCGFAPFRIFNRANAISLWSMHNKMKILTKMYLEDSFIQGTVCNLPARVPNK